MKRSIIGLAVAALLAVVSTGAQAEVRLQGAGATFPAPYYARLVAEYQKLHPQIKIDYQSIGSGGGIKGITDCTIDFAASDAPMNKKELEAAGGADKIIQIPSCAGGVVPAYNVPGVKDIKFTGEVLAEIYLGTISKWNDPKIAALNAGVTLPDMPITPAWRTDGSGTTYVWTNYLATQSETFKSTVGLGKQVKWPTGQGGKGSEGVAQILQLTPGSIGYVEENYANKNNISYGSVKNKAGNFTKASPEAVSLAGEGAAADLTGNVLSANLWNQPGDKTYPIASFTYLIVYKDLKNIKAADKAQALADFLTWATHDGQKFATELDYAPLAPAVVTKVEAALATLSYQGQPIKAKN